MHLLDHPHFKLMRHDVINPLFIEVDEIYNLACPASPVHCQSGGEGISAHWLEIRADLQTLPTDDPKQRQPDIPLARQYLDWEPDTKLEDGLKLTIGYFNHFLTNTPSKLDIISQK